MEFDVGTSSLINKKIFHVSLWIGGYNLYLEYPFINCISIIIFVQVISCAVYNFSWLRYRHIVGRIKFHGSLKASIKGEKAFSKKELLSRLFFEAGRKIVAIRSRRFCKTA